MGIASGGEGEGSSWCRCNVQILELIFTWIDLVNRGLDSYIT